MDHFVPEIKVVDGGQVFTEFRYELCQSFTHEAITFACPRDEDVTESLARLLMGGNFLRVGFSSCVTGLFLWLNNGDISNERCRGVEKKIRTSLPCLIHVDGGFLGCGDAEGVSNSGYLVTQHVVASVVTDVGKLVATQRVVDLVAVVAHQCPTVTLARGESEVGR